MPSKIELFHGDCLEVMLDIPDGSVDMVLCDLPYGTTRCAWDVIIPFEPLWEQYKRIIKPNGVIALFASQPFTSFLVTSQPELFRSEWVWIKNRGSNFANTVREPMKEHESILIFSRGKWTYNKQMQERTGGGLERTRYLVEHNAQHRETTRQFEGRSKHSISELRVPSSWQKFNIEVGLHPTQKPVALCEYLIRTYTNDGETVLDNCAGSGTTGVACLRTMRSFIGIEKEERYFKIASDRIRKEQDDIEQSLYYRACDMQE